jgi:hypothetical protein
MKLEIDSEDLKPILSDVLESLDIMRAFKNGEVRKEDSKKLTGNGCRRLTRARNDLSKLLGKDI